MQVLPSSELWHRGDFPLLCEWRKLYRVVEVGVDRGEFAECFLTRCWNCLIYLAIDPYEKYGEMPWDREADFLTAVQRLGKFPVAKLIRERSEDAALAISLITETRFYGDKFDFVYIDGSHVKEDVARDIAAWWPLVSDRGILAGHDWDMPSGDHAGVQQAVREFAELNDLTVYYTPDDPSSWYIYKCGIPGADWKRVD